MKDRKLDHLNLALKSQTLPGSSDKRFLYEPLCGHSMVEIKPFDLAGKTMKFPIWISSMTGGTAEAEHINNNLARVCAEFGLGMGLGSCRIYMDKKGFEKQFELRKIVGYELPLWANLGIGQIEKALANNSISAIDDMVDRLQADGLIVHINPLQEFFQDEGDVFTQSPYQTLYKFIEKSRLKVMVKEVGQGFGPESLKLLMQLPLAAIEFGAFGGTNFSKVEINRGESVRKSALAPLAMVGNSAYDMLDYIRDIKKEGSDIQCKTFIASGGIRHFLDGYYFINSMPYSTAFGMASQFLIHARGEYETLKQFVLNQIEGLNTASAYLRINPKYNKHD